MKKISLVIFLSVFLFSSPVRAEAYAFYVDDSCSDDRDGSESKPFCDIADALEKAGNGDKIYIKDGIYEENVKLPKGVSLRGKSESGVVISGYVEMDDESSLENLTVSGSSINIRIKKDADVEIDDCTIKEAKQVGIQTEIGGGKLKVKNSKIRDGGKGLYIQSGKNIEMTGNEIYD
ncbi:MAG: right-handed parallel beta-helix repeat-containing protein, partial [Patescibacteria group bacterium]